MPLLSLIDCCVGISSRCLRSRGRGASSGFVLLLCFSVILYRLPCDQPEGLRIRWIYARYQSERLVTRNHWAFAVRSFRCCFCGQSLYDCLSILHEAGDGVGPFVG